MAVDQWNYYQSAASTFFGITVIHAIAGSGALRFDRKTETASGIKANGTIQDASGIAHGYQHGVVRSLLTVPANAVAGSYLGLACLQDQDDLTATGQAFAAVCRVNEFAVVTAFQLLKLSVGLAHDGDASVTILTEETGLSIAQGTVIPIEFEWHADPDGIGGALLVGRRGTLQNFSDLADKWEVIEGPLWTPRQAEGPCFYGHGTGAVNLVQDTTTVMELQA